MAGKIKILYLNYSYDIGGIETWIRNACALLPQDRFETAVCSLSDCPVLAGEFKAMGVPLHVMRKKEGIDYSLIFRLKGLCGAAGVDVLHTHNAAQWFYGTFAAMGGRMVSLVHTQHSVPGDKPSRLPIALKCLASRTRAVVSVAGCVSRYLSSSVGLQESDIRLIHNGIGTERYDGRVRKETAREMLGIPKDRLTIGAIGRFVPIEDQGNLLSAFKAVADILPGVQFVLAGDGPLQGELARCAWSLGIGEKVFFLGGQCDVPQILAALDVFVLSSLREGLPMTLLEAMASGLPSVVTEVGGNGEVMRDGETGCLVPPSNARALAGALRSVLADPDKRARYGRAARARVQEEFTLKKMIREYSYLYELTAGCRNTVPV